MLRAELARLAVEFVAVLVSQQRHDSLLGAVLNEAWPVHPEFAQIEGCRGRIHAVSQPLVQKLARFPWPFLEEHESRATRRAVYVAVVVLAHHDVAVSLAIRA